MDKILIVAIVLIALGAGLFFFLNMEETEKPGPVGPRDIELPAVEAPEKEVDTTGIPQFKTPSGQDTAVPAQKGYFGEIRGKVTDMEGHPLEDVEITLFSYSYIKPPQVGRVRPRHEETRRTSTKSNAEGIYLFEELGDVQAPYLSMRFEKTGYSELLKDSVGPGMIIDAKLEKGSPISIRVIDKVTKKPIAGVVADLSMQIPGRSKHEYRRWRREFKSNNDGLIEVVGAPSEKLTIFLEHPDYEWFFRRPEDGIWVDWGKNNEYTFEMKPGVKLDGLVVDARTKEPIRDCLVTLREIIVPTRREKTGVFGKFSMSGLNRGAFEFNFEAEGYTRLTRKLEISDEAMAKPVVFELLPAGMASGTVVDPNGNPVVGAEIYVAEARDIFRTVRNELETTTDRQGVFSIRNLDDSRSYRVVAYTPGLALGVSADFMAISGEFFDGVIVQLEKGSTIQGRVTDSTGAPIRGVSVTLEQPPYAGAWFPPGSKLGQKSTLATVTDEAGYWKFEGLWSGPYQVTADHPEYIVMLPEEVRIDRVDAVIDKNIELLRGHTISGQVVGSDGKPVAGATVSGSIGLFLDRSFTTRTDEKGEYRLSRLLDRPYRMKAWSSQGVAREVYDIPVGSSGVNFRLEDFGILEGAVMSYEGSQPLDRFTVTIMPLMALEGRPESAVRQNDSRLNQKLMTSHEAYGKTEIVNPDGRFTISGIHPGSYTVEVTAPDRVGMEVAKVTVPPGGASTTQAFVLRSGASFQGRVTDSAGQPVPGNALRIRLVTARNSNIESTVGPDGKPALQQGALAWAPRDVALDQDGKFYIGGLPAGVIEVQMSSPTYCCPEWESITFGKEGTIERDYQLIRGAKVAFRVVDQFDEPVQFPNARVYDLEGEQARVDGRVVAARGDLNGTVEIAKLKPGRYTVEFQVHAYAMARVEIEVKEGEEFFQDIVMEKLIR